MGGGQLWGYGQSGPGNALNFKIVDRSVRKLLTLRLCQKRFGLFFNHSELVKH